jgi:hypothetical protein
VELRWQDLSLGQQCVLVTALDQADVSNALSELDPNPDPAREAVRSEIEQLAGDVVALDGWGLIEASAEHNGPALHGDKLREVLANLGAWLPDDEGALDVVVWLVPTDDGIRVMSTATEPDKEAYRHRPGRA